MSKQCNEIHKLTQIIPTINYQIPGQLHHLLHHPHNRHHCQIAGRLHHQRLPAEAPFVVRPFQDKLVLLF